MKKKRIYIPIIIVIFIFSIIIIEMMNPLRKSEEKLTEDILMLTPMGTSMEDVIDVIESHKKWEWDGYIAPYGICRSSFTIKLDSSQSIKVMLGSYRKPFPFVTGVFAEWGFDENSRLTDIWVYKEEFLI